MDFKKIGKAILFPHIAIILILIPVATVFLVYALIFLGTDSIAAIISYLIAFYTLVVWCVRIPELIKFIKNFKEENKYILIWRGDAHLRVKISLYGTLLINTAYSLLNLGLGFWHHTFWYYSLAGYYISLVIMRFFLVRYTSKHQAGEDMEAELVRYRRCGIIFLIMNLALALIVFFMVYWNRTFRHHEITTITMAAYTFTSLTMAIISLNKYRKYNSPVYSASKAISLASASVSMLTLECTMLTTFDDGTLGLEARRLMLGLSGGAIVLFIIVLAVMMIVRGTIQLRKLRNEKEAKNG